MQTKQSYYLIQQPNVFIQRNIRFHKYRSAYYDFLFRLRLSILPVPFRIHYRWLRSEAFHLLLKMFILIVFVFCIFIPFVVLVFI